MRKPVLWLLAAFFITGAAILVIRVPEGHRGVTLPQGAPPIVTLVGTSLTASSTWPDALAEKLRPCGIQVVRVAKPGSNSTWGLSQRDAIRDTNSGLVVIEFAINDADIRIGEHLWQSLQNHRALIEDIKADRVILMTTSPAYGKLRRRRPLLPLYYQAYRQMAEHQGTGLADVAPLWRIMPQDALPDGLHPTNESAETVIVPALAPLISEAFGRAC